MCLRENLLDPALCGGLVLGISVFIKKLRRTPEEKQKLISNYSFIVFKGTGFATRFRYGKIGNLGNTGVQKILQIAEKMNENIKSFCRKAFKQENKRHNK